MLDNLRRSLVPPTMLAHVRCSAGFFCPHATALVADASSAARALPRVLLAGRRDGLSPAQRELRLDRPVDVARLRGRHVARRALACRAAASGMADDRCDSASALPHDRLPQAPARVGDRRRCRETRRAPRPRRSGAQWGPMAVVCGAHRRSQPRSARLRGSRPRIPLVADLAGRSALRLVGLGADCRTSIEPLSARRAPRAAAHRAQDVALLRHLRGRRTATTLRPTTSRKTRVAWSRGELRRRTSGCSCCPTSAPTTSVT